MGWSGLSVLVGLVALALHTAPWGLLLFLLLIPFFWEPKRSKRPSSEFGGAVKSDDAVKVAASTPHGSPTASASPRFIFNSVEAERLLAERKRPRAAVAEVAALPVVASQLRADDHFRRHAHTPGWLYVARNELHAADLFKLGYTTINPQARIRTLNAEAQGVTTAIGRFQLVHSRAVPMSYTAEQEVFARLAQFRVSSGREFFQGPQALIVAAVDAVADQAAGLNAAQVPEQQMSIATCPGCGRVQRHEATPFASAFSLYCSPCGTAWSHDITT